MPELQSRRGNTSVAPNVRHENNTIKASSNDSLAGAARNSSALAATDTNAATKPIARVCRRVTAARMPANQGTPIAMSG